MARFKFVRINRRRVEVQKVRFRVKIGMLVIAFACAFIVWLYVKGSTPPEQPPVAETQPVETQAAESQTETSAETETDVSSADDGGL